MSSISFISAFDTEKNIGGEYNRLIENINDDWIFIRDGDCLFLTTDYGDKIQAILNAYGSEFDVIGATTNRLSLLNHTQRIKGIQDEDSITKHIGISKELWKKYGTKVESTTGPVAAMCMFFKRKVWEKNKFIENSPYLDKRFCDSAINNGFKLGIAKGLYVLHLYRWEYKKDPQNHFNHLVNRYGTE